jgi:hypothetical protein
MYVYKGGDLYGFCPGKATWDSQNVKLFRILVIAAETGAMMVGGGLEDQPDWFIDMLGWFLPRFDHIKFSTKAQAVLGDGSDTKGVVKNGGNNRQLADKRKS